MQGLIVENISNMYKVIGEDTNYMTCDSKRKV